MLRAAIDGHDAHRMELLETPLAAHSSRAATVLALSQLITLALDGGSGDVGGADDDEGIGPKLVAAAARRVLGAVWRDAGDGGACCAVTLMHAIAPPPPMDPDEVRNDVSHKDWFPQQLE